MSPHVTTISGSQQNREMFEPPTFILHLLDFLHEFLVSFLLPLVVVVLCALVAAALALRL
jgi:hypothetical protein